MKHIIFLWLFTVNSYALDCPQENSSTPLCPTSGSTMLDDTYPVQSFVISDSATGDKTAETSKVPARFIENIFDSYFNSEFENMPQVILSVQTEDDHKRIVEEVREKLKSKKINETEIEKAIKQITFRKAVAYTWQQDYFESFFNPETGRPVVRKVQEYEKAMRIKLGDFSTLASAGGSCGITSGDEMVTDPKSSSVAAEMGGNIEGAQEVFALSEIIKVQITQKAFVKMLKM